MNRIFLAVLCGFCLLTVSQARADISVSNLLSYQAVTGLNTTNNGATVLLGTAYIPLPPNFSIQNGGLALGSGTNSLTGYLKIGTDTNTVTSTVTTYHPATTNATDDVISPGSLTVNIYAQMQIVTTTNLSVGVKAIYNKP